MNFTLAEATQLLSRTPVVLGSLLKGLPEEWVRSSEGGESFSPFDVVGHLIDGEETDWIPRARIILAQQPGQSFQPHDRFRHRERNKGRTLEFLLDEFARLRQANLAIVTGWRITPVQLALTAQHPSLGTVTLSQLIATWTVHDLGHIAQIARVMAKQFGPAVGSWRQFLPVLTDRT